MPEPGSEPVSAEPAATTRPVDPIRAIDRARSLSRILDLIVDCASPEAARVALLLVRGRELHAWRFIGFGLKLDQGSDTVIPIDHSGIIADLLRAGNGASSRSGSDCESPSFARLPQGRMLFAALLSVGGEPVAVLYADAGIDDERQVLRPATLKIVAQHGARCLESMVALRSMELSIPSHFYISRSGLSGTVTQAPERRAFGTEGAADTGGEESEEHYAARLYARLLASDIKLNHEAEVVAGRRERDLASRLGGEIARARLLYEERVPSHIRRVTDYLDAQLVSILAGEDASLLQKRP